MAKDLLCTTANISITSQEGLALLSNAQGLVLDADGLPDDTEQEPQRRLRKLSYL
jgi:hypothetical protein